MRVAEHRIIYVLFILVSDVLCSGCRTGADVTAAPCNSQSRRRSHIADARQTGSDVGVARRQKTTQHRRGVAAAECHRLPDRINDRRFGVNDRVMFVREDRRRVLVAGFGCPTHWS